jgi:hypothetical protein
MQNFTVKIHGFFQKHFFMSAAAKKHAHEKCNSDVIRLLLTNILLLNFLPFTKFLLALQNTLLLFLLMLLLLLQLLLSSSKKEGK